MTDPYDYTPLRDHIRNVLDDHANGGTDGLDDAVQAIFDHPEFAAAWDHYERNHPAHGMHKLIGGEDAWWSATEQVWKWEPVEA
jgi:hypothetical protein